MVSSSIKKNKHTQDISAEKLTYDKIADVSFNEDQIKKALSPIQLLFCDWHLMALN